MTVYPLSLLENNQYMRFLLFCFAVLMITLPTHAQNLSISPLFSDGAVLQRDQKITVWGWAEQGARITLEFDGTHYHTKAKKEGRWEIQLPAMPAGGPHHFLIRTNEGTQLEIKNILFGDVWICSGQSNMEWTVNESQDAALERTKARDTQIRHFKVPLTHAETPQEQLPGGQWAVNSPETVGDFTAVGYFFARELRQHVDVPIGLLNTSWGGSRIEAWLPGKVLNVSNFEEAKQLVYQQVGADYQRAKQTLEDRIGPLPDTEKGLVNGVAHWAAPAFDDSDWEEVTLPSVWEAYGYESVDGIGWVRKTFTLSQEDLQEEVRLVLGRIDDSDITWLNGQEIGRTNQQWNKVRVYTVPKNLLKVGPNVIAIRIEDTGGGGGLAGAPEELSLQVGATSRSLAGPWRFKLDLYQFAPLTSPNKLPTVLYNQMVYPLHHFPVKGFLWYQGESNTDPESLPAYGQQLKGLIESWRKNWDAKKAPFLIVQLANFMPEDQQPQESNWAALRAQQGKALELEQTAQIITIDVGEADDIHPRDKQTVGYRLSLAARNLAYEQKNVPYQGPTYRSHQLEGSRVLVRFDHAEELLVTNKYGYIQGFALAGPDGTFRWAKATLEDGAVVVWQDDIQQPRALRYAWSDNPGPLNLYNAAGLPAVPFEVKW